MKWGGLRRNCCKEGEKRGKEKVKEGEGGTREGGCREKKLSMTHSEKSVCVCMCVYVCVCIYVGVCVCVCAADKAHEYMRLSHSPICCG